MTNLYDNKKLAEDAEKEIDLEKNNLKEKREFLNKWINMEEIGTLYTSKEEALQGEFLLNIFSNLLNAVNVTDGKDKWNLERETKTEIDGQKADGVLGFFDKKGNKDVRAVIELKGPTINLDSKLSKDKYARTPVEQAFGYAPKYGASCQWVIVSNFKEIRLYRSNSMLDYQVFYLENLKDDLEFKKFVYLLSFESLVGAGNEKSKSLKLSEEYQKEQIEIEKKFYNLYKQIRIDIFENIRNNNKNISEYIILEKVQKLLDRFLFICFCEDKNLLPRNSFQKVIDRGTENRDFGVFEYFKSLCSWINIGNPKHEIPHFNGGLFKADEDLDTLMIDDVVFEKMQAISEYNFDSELNENILGHIFEQSISDIEEFKSQINEQDFDVKKGKRKKDGIFYTPKYITKYIVENTINYWLEDKRKELGEDKLPILTDEDYNHKYKNKASSVKLFSENYKKRIDFWKRYKEAIKNIKILDPACGSGAFLITAFEFLLKQTNEIDKKLLDLTGEQDLFSDTTRYILENNIFGVDLNRESVEITKLSLWLKSANKNKTLTTLENNIKCGNSLIKDKEIAKDFVFDWEKEFPEVFKNGGFDIVIGNPPYVRQETIKEIKPYLEQNYKVYTGVADLYCYFYELGYNLLKDNGYLGFITSNKWFRAKYGEKLREFLLSNTEFYNIVDYNGTKVFEGATVDSNILIFKKNRVKNSIFSLQIADTIPIEYEQEKLSKESFIFINQNEDSIKEKIERIGKPLKEWDININRGITTGLNDAFIIDKETKDKLLEEDYKNSEIIKPLLRGKDIEKYNINYADFYLINSHNGKAGKGAIDIENYPQIKKWLERFEPKLSKRADKGKTPFNLRNCAYLKEFEKEKIVWQRVTKENTFALAEKDTFILDSMAFLSNIEKEKKYLLGILNSKLIYFYLNQYTHKYGNNGFLLSNQYVEKLPIKPYNNEIELENKVDLILENNKKLSSYKELLGRAKKNKKYDEIIDLEKLVEKTQDEIKKLDYEINQMVYKIYELTVDEIKIIENS
ncbi:Eco57I restriction-modification methylase domain-containing protein [Fusobacterium pseudoperiodonticum]|jgi:N-6 DNA methylase|uniref:Eco57I restriction-modification methylase domain-containing protein n=1 Tax=Fusobacterium pseudoperiodonticum TaxID=2663009 RepID=UPI0028D49A16|nr:N-6 DNA methylase [Fusobacterium pseudoperiodonticum]